MFAVAVMLAAGMSDARADYSCPAMYSSCTSENYRLTAVGILGNSCVECEDDEYAAAGNTLDTCEACYANSGRGDNYHGAMTANGQCNCRTGWILDLDEVTCHPAGFECDEYTYLMTNPDDSQYCSDINCWYQTGSAPRWEQGGVCVFSCDASHHERPTDDCEPEDLSCSLAQICDPNVIGCDIANGRGERVWNGTAYGACTVAGCNSGFNNINNIQCAPAAPVTCQPGEYLTAAGECEECTDGYCLGGSWTIDGQPHGISECPAPWDVWDDGMSSIDQCYRTTCEQDSVEIDNGWIIYSPMDEQGVWINYDNPCASVVACDTNFHAEGLTCIADTGACPAGYTDGGSAVWDGSAWNYDNCGRSCSLTYAPNVQTAIQETFVEYPRTCPTEYSVVGCNAQYYLENPTDQDCAACPVNHYCVGNGTVAHPCPNGGFSPAQSDTAEQCYTLPVTAIAHGTANSRCEYNNITQVYDNCVVVSVATCDAGYYAVGNACVGVGSGYWSNADRTTRTECPAGYSGSDGARDSAQTCYKNCGAISVLHAATIEPVNASEHYGVGQYPVCTYSVTCESGYVATDNATANPTCSAQTVSVSYSANGGTGGGPMDLDIYTHLCTFGEPCRLAKNTTFMRAGYRYTGWMDAPSGGTTYADNLLIPASPFTELTIMYAQWANCNTAQYNDGTTLTCKAVVAGWEKTGCNVAGNTCTGTQICGPDTYSNGSATGYKCVPCAAGSFADGDGNTSCQTLTCNSDEHLSADYRSCEPNVIACPITNGTGESTWNGTNYGSCVATGCSAGYGLTGNACNKCNVANAATYTPNTCDVATCANEFHVAGGVCASNVVSCPIANGTGTQTWNGTGYGVCTVASCDANYHMVGNACVADSGNCPAGYSGTAVWTGTEWNYESCTKQCSLTPASNVLSIEYETVVTYPAACPLMYVVTQCKTGFYLAAPLAQNCIEVENGYYQDGDTGRALCPAGANGSDAPRGSNGTCYKTCPDKNWMSILGATGVTNNYPKQHWDFVTDRYPECSYTVVCGAGYDAADNGTANPSCAPRTIELTFSPNYGTGSYGPIQCTRGTVCAIPRINVQTDLFPFKRPGYRFQGWMGRAVGGSGFYGLGSGGDIESSIMSYIGAFTADVQIVAGWTACSAGTYNDGVTMMPDACQNITSGYGGTGCAADGTACTGQSICAQDFYSNSGTNYLCAACPAGTYNEGAGNGQCYDQGCAADEHWDTSARQCEPNVIPCDVLNGTGTRTWNGTNYGSCVATGCSAGYGLSGNACNKCNVANAATYAPNTCDVATCANEFHVAGNACANNVVSCPIANGTGTQTWNGTDYGLCVVTDCNTGFEEFLMQCRACNKENAASYLHGGCDIETCVDGYILDGGVCVAGTRACTVSNAISAEMTWANGKFGTCRPLECEYGYHISSNACVLDQRPCTVANGSGVQYWETDHWGECAATLCQPGYADYGNGCARCDNYLGVDGQPAVKTYSSECVIASCMYQGEKYNLAGGECELVCDLYGREDETGTMIWNSVTNKCDRTCAPGFVLW